MQLLAETRAPDFTGWKAAFDAEAETISNAGLNTLQIWQAEDDAVLVLFEVRNRARAQAWLDTQAGFGRGMTARFLKTA